MQRAISPRLVLVAVAAAVLALALAAQARAVTSVTLGATSVTLSNPDMSADDVFAISIDPVGPGAADDVLVIDEGLGMIAAGCVLSVGNTHARCPLGAARTQITGTWPGNLLTVNGTIDLDRPGVEMSAVITGGPNPNRFDASATTVGDVTLNGAGGDDVLIGGGGDDVLAGSTANDTLTGGPGDDSLSGEAGNDTMAGGPGDDVLVPGAGASESADGGEGTRDSISFAAETVPVSVSLDGVANDGPQGHPVTIAGVEDVVGGLAADTITGNGAFNQLSGRAGNDVIDGGGGVADVLRGGKGDDSITARSASPGFSDVGCGGGTDTATVDAVDVVASDCEAVARAATPPPPPGAGGGGGGGGAAGDTAPPAVTLTGVAGHVARTALLKGVTVTIATSERARVLVELVGTATGARLMALTDNLVVARRLLPLGAGRRAARLVPAAALVKGARKLVVRVTATDAAGNARTVRRTLRITG